jgi:hypothetical protein
MKSAYELAMERLAESDPDSSRPLSEATKAALAEVDRKFSAKIAELEVFLNQQLQQARRSRDLEAVRQLERQLADEKARLGDERERAKEKVRQAQAC